jgi:hypothetical protein
VEIYMLGVDGYDIYIYIYPWDDIWKYIIDFASWPTRLRQLAGDRPPAQPGSQSPSPPRALTCLAGTIMAPAAAYRPQRAWGGRGRSLSVFTSKILLRPFRPAFLSKNTAHFVWEMAHLADNPILICSLRIICDTRNHCVHDFDPTDVGEYM